MGHRRSTRAASAMSHQAFIPSITFTSASIGTVIEERTVVQGFERGQSGADAVDHAAPGVIELADHHLNICSL